jgi:hypothetical protein
MAERFGGKYSPGGGAENAPAPGFRGRRRARGSGRVNILFAASLPFFLSAFFHDAAGLALNLGAGGLILLSAWLTREGIKAQAAYEARRIAKRPAIPRKLFGAAAAAVALGLAGLADGAPVNGAIYAVLGAALHLFSFGLDPMRDKGAEGVDAFQSERVARAVDEAERHLGAMTEAARRAGDRAVEARVERFQATAREMFRTVEQDPRDLTGARRWLGVYLLGARDATVKFADLHSRTRDAGAKAEYLALLDDLEQGFAERTRKMLLDDRSDLDVEIEVLRDRLDREAVRHDR